jgi:hypothetical protein
MWAVSEKHTANIFKIEVWRQYVLRNMSNYLPDITVSYLSKDKKILTYLLKANTVEPEKQLFLANGSETVFISKQRLGKHVPAATDTHAIEVLLETVVSTQSVQRGYKEDN